MVELIGSVKETVVENGKIMDTWRIPSLSERLVRRQAHTNARVKGRNNVEIMSVEQIGKGDLPRQKIFKVETRSDR